MKLAQAKLLQPKHSTSKTSRKHTESPTDTLQNRSKPSLSIIYTLLSMLGRQPLIMHPIKIAVAIGGKVFEHKTLYLAQIMGVPALAINFFDWSLEALLFILLIKWVVEAVIDSYLYIRKKLSEAEP
jgi:hypothetical protein